MTYLLGSYQLGRFLSSTKVYHEADAASRDDFIFAQIVHDGDWDPDPSAVHNLLKHVRDNSTLTIKFKKVSVQPRDPKATGYPLLYMTGHHEFHWTDEEAGVVAALPQGRRPLPAEPQFEIRQGGLGGFVRVGEGRGDMAVLGPLIRNPDGTTSSGLAFPRIPQAVGHAFLGPFLPGNRFTATTGRRAGTGRRRGRSTG